MEIDVSELDESGKDFSHVYEPAEIEIGDEGVELSGPISLKVHASSRGSEVRIKGSLEFRARIDCVRCLGTSDLAFSPNFELLYAPETVIAAEGAHELAKEDLGFSFFTDNSINLEDLVQEQVLLALPDHYLCKDDCKGLCPICGSDKNAPDSCRCQETRIDPRWDALRNLN